MAKYNWTYTDLENRYEKLKKMFYHEDNQLIRNDILNDINILEAELINFYDSKESNQKIISKFEQFKLDINYLSSLIPIIKDFYDLTYNKEIVIPKLKKMTFTNEEMMQISHDFFRFIGHPFYGYFKKFANTSRNHLKFSYYNGTKTCGNNIFLRSLNESFINVKKFENIDDLTTIIHEIEHTIVGYINPYFLETYFCEIDTNAFELEFLKYYYDLTKSGEVFYSSARRFNSAACSVYEIYNLIILMEKEQELGRPFTRNKEIKDYSEKYCHISKEEITSILDYYSTDMLLSLIGEIYAIEFAYLFDYDKNLTRNYLKQLIEFKPSNSKNYVWKLKRFGIIPNQHFNEYYNTIQNKVLNLSKNRK